MAASRRLGNQLVRPKIVGEVLKSRAVFGRKRIGGGSPKGFTGRSFQTEGMSDNGIAEIANLLKNLR